MRNFTFISYLLVAFTFISCLPEPNHNIENLETSSDALAKKLRDPAILSISGPSSFQFEASLQKDIIKETFTLSNTGVSSATAVSFDALSAPFSIESNTCPSRIRPSQSCSFVISYNPANQAEAVNEQNLAVNYYDGFKSSSTVKYLSGALPSEMSMAKLIFSSAVSTDFGPLDLNQTMSKSFTITNNGSASSTSMSLSGLASPFSVSTTCGSSLTALASCNVVVTFTPTVAGTKSDTLVLNYHDGSSIKSLQTTFSGTGTDPVVVTPDPTPTPSPVYDTFSNGDFSSGIEYWTAHNSKIEYRYESLRIENINTDPAGAYQDFKTEVGATYVVNGTGSTERAQKLWYEIYNGQSFNNKIATSNVISIGDPARTAFQVLEFTAISEVTRFYAVISDVNIGVSGYINEVSIQKKTDEPVVTDTAPLPTAPIAGPGGTIYYVDSIGGSDSNDGKTENSAWKTLSKVSGQAFTAGDFIAFKRGGIWTGEFRPLSGGAVDNPITFGAYGTGPKPILSSLTTSKFNWVSLGNNLWKTTDSPGLVRRLAKNGNEILPASSIDEIGRRVPSLIAWYHDGTTLTLYSDTDPNLDNFTYSTNLFTIKTKNRNNITFQDLEIHGGSITGMEFVTSNNISMIRLDLGYMSHQGILFSSYDSLSSNITIKDCHIDAHWSLNYFEGGNGFYSMRGAREGIFFTGNFNNVIIQNNFIKNWQHSGINVWANPSASYSINNMKIIDNYLTSPDIPYGGRLSFAGNSHNSEIAYNTFENMYGGRMQMDGNDNHVHHNLFKNMRDARIKSNEGGAIRLGNWNGRSNYNHLIESNLFINCYSSAIIVGGTNHPPYTVHDITFKNNIFHSDTADSEYRNYFFILAGDSTKNIHLINNNIVADPTKTTILYSGSNYTTSEFENITTLNGETANGNYSNSTYTLSVGQR